MTTVDISYWQGKPYKESPDSSGVDFDKLIANTEGVCIRAGLGVQEDRRFQEFATVLLDRHPGRIGAYWYVLDEINGGWQADSFFSVVGGFELDYLVADFEDANFLTQTALRARYKYFLDTLESHTDTKLEIYTRASFWDYHIGVAGWESKYDGWFADYSLSPPRTPKAWGGKWLRHQTTDKGDGASFGVVSHAIDLNVVNSEVVPPIPNPNPEPIETPKTGRVASASGLNLRSRAITGTGLIRKMANGTKLFILGEKLNSSGYDWFIVQDELDYVGYCAKNWVNAD